MFSSAQLFLCSSRASCKVSTLSACSKPMLNLPSLAGAHATTRAEIPYWAPLLQVFGGMFLPSLFALLFYLNLLAWSAARINHVLIFELDVSPSGSTTLRAIADPIETPQVRTRLDTRQFIEVRTTRRSISSAVADHGSRTRRSRLSSSSSSPFSSGSPSPTSGQTTSHPAPTRSPSSSSPSPCC